MATITRYIYSNYDPDDREALEIATGQVPTDDTGTNAITEELEDPWQTESTFGAQRRLAAAPRFVPAAISYDEVNNMLGGVPREVIPPALKESKADVSGWYRSLTRSGVRGTSNAIAGASYKRSDTASASNSTPSQATSSVTCKPTVVQPRPNKNNWFITRALRSEFVSAPAAPYPTLADILERDPPLSSSKPFKPPVFLALGPANRGWAMLQQKGWTEGEGLGATASRRVVEQGTQPSFILDAPERREKLPAKRQPVKTETQEVVLDSDGEISELRRVEVVDLTLSSSDDELAEEFDAVELPPCSGPSTSAPSRSISPHSTPLLTPIPTVLKSDRLGIGLKAKTAGPYKASKKRVTHNQAALAAHIRANEEIRRLKAKTGRGSRGFARLAKADSEQRRQLLASLNEG